MQLPINLPLEMMQARWKSILDPLLSDDGGNQVVVGPAQTQIDTTASTSYVTLTYSPIIDFVANTTGNYQINGTFFIENTTANALTSIQIASTLGAPTILFKQDAAEGQSSASANGVSVSPYVLAKLNQNTRYKFELQMKVSSGTGRLRNDIFTAGQALIARAI